MPNIILRIRSSAGVSRVKLDDGDALYDLKVKLASQINVPLEQQVISFDANGARKIEGD